MRPYYGELGETYAWMDISAQATTLTFTLQYRDNFTGGPQEFGGLLHSPCSSNSKADDPAESL